MIKLQAWQSLVLVVSILAISVELLATRYYRYKAHAKRGGLRVLVNFSRVLRAFCRFNKNPVSQVDYKLNSHLVDIYTLR